MAKKDNIIIWIIGIAVLLLVLNYFGIIDFSQLFAIEPKTEILGQIKFFEPIKHYVV